VRPHSKSKSFLFSALHNSAMTVSSACPQMLQILSICSVLNSELILFFFANLNLFFLVGKLSQAALQLQILILLGTFADEMGFQVVLELSVLELPPVNHLTPFLRL
jgi:hypothetical protein